MAKRNVLYAGLLPPHPGGSATWAGGLLPKLADIGHSIEAIAPLPEGLPWNDAALTRVRISVRRYPVAYFDTDPFANPDRDFYVRQDGHLHELAMPLVRSGWAEAILVGNETFLGRCLALARGAEIPLIGMVHTIYWATTPSPRPADFAPGGTLANLRRCDRVVCVARHVEAVLRNLGITHATAIPNAVDLGRFRFRPRPVELAEQLGITPDSKVVAHVANLKPVKQAWRLIEAAPAILARHTDAVFLILGEGPCEDDLRERCANHGIDDRVRLLGWVDHDLLPDYYALADVVVMPSLSEAAPFGYLEALASGCPVVATPIDAAREFLSDMPHCVIARSHEPSDIATAVCRVLANAGDPRRRQRVAHAAAARFDVNDAAARFSALIDSVKATGAPDRE